MNTLLEVKKNRFKLKYNLIPEADASVDWVQTYFISTFFKVSCFKFWIFSCVKYVFMLNFLFFYNSGEPVKPFNNVK